MRPFFAPLVFGALVCSGASGLSQNLLFEFEGQTPGSRFGHVIDAAGDVNGDGVLDILIGAPYDDSGGIESGAAYVYSGADGVMLHALCGDTPGDHFGWAVSRLGDVNEDGLDDFLVGAPDDDTFAPQSGRAFLFSGHDGSVLFEVEGAWSGFRVGSAVRGVGDLDGDGVDDWLVGAQGDTTFGVGTIRAMSGADAAELFVTYGGELSASIGGTLTVQGDSDGDGVLELLLDFGVEPDNDVFVKFFGIAPGAVTSYMSWFFHPYPPWSSRAGRGGQGGARVLTSYPDGFQDFGGVSTVELRNSADGLLIHSMNIGSQGVANQFGATLDGGGDRNGDGFSDVLVAAPEHQVGSEPRAGRVFLYSGADASLMSTFDGDSERQHFGEVLSFIGDLDGDGKDEFAIASLQLETSFEGAGFVRVYGGCDAPTPNTYCASTPNSAGPGASMDWSGPTSVATNGFRLQASGLPPTNPGIFFYGQDQVSVPLGDGMRCVGGVFGIHRMDAVFSSPSGEAEQLLDFTAPPASSGSGQITPGSTWNFQFWYRDIAAGGAGSNLSNGLTVTFCP